MAKSRPAKIDALPLGISNEEVEDLRWNIIHDLHAKDAAKKLLSWATFYIQTGVPMPEKLRRVLCDGLEHLEHSDALGAFGHIRSPGKSGPGRRRPETDYEWLHVLRDVLRVWEGGVPLTGPGEKYPFKALEGTAFMEYAKQHKEGNEAAIKKEARRLQAGFWKHVRALPEGNLISLGLAAYIPRNK